MAIDRTSLIHLCIGVKNKNINIAWKISKKLTYQSKILSYLFFDFIKQNKRKFTAPPSLSPEVERDKHAVYKYLEKRS